jgi:Protein of unknown function (DUF3352)
MSTNVPGQPEQNQPAHLEPEYLQPGPVPGPAEPSGQRPARGRRTGLVVGAAVAVVAAVGAGAYGVLQVMSGGESPATAVPADAVGYVSLDLDPSAAQKIEAFRILRKFPSLRKEIGGRDDIRRAVFDQIRSEEGCTDLDYARDVEPWVGDRVALAAVPDGKRGAVPLLVLQVRDQAAARAGATKLEACGRGAVQDAEPSPRVGFSFVGDYLLVAESRRQADAMARDAEAASLADSTDFTRALERTGDPGIVTMYASPDLPAAVATASGSRSALAAYRDFRGGAGVVRFADGAVEAEFSAQGLPESVAGAGAGSDLATLPGSTAAAFAVAFRDGWVQDYLDQLQGALGDGESSGDILTQAEQATGLQLPEDLETLLGDGVTVSVDAGVDLRALSESPDPTDVPLGMRIHGDPAAIVPIIDKLKKAAGPEADVVNVASADGVVTVALDPAYGRRLLQDGDLGSSASLAEVVPEADRASGAFFLDFDAGDGWSERLADLLSDGDADVRADVAPLDALGLSSWTDDDDVQHGLLRLTTD